MIEETKHSRLSKTNNWGNFEIHHFHRAHGFVARPNSTFRFKRRQQKNSKQITVFSPNPSLVEFKRYGVFGRDDAFFPLNLHRFAWRSVRIQLQQQQQQPTQVPILSMAVYNIFGYNV